MQVLKLTDLTFRYSDGPTVFSQQNFDIPIGGITGITGANGSGKTTLLRLLGGILHSDNASLSSARKRFQLVYIDENILSLRHLRVSEYLNVVRALALTKPFLELIPSQMMNAFVKDLSNGQRARLVLSIAFGTACDALLLDEPFNGIDADGRELAVSRLLKLSQPIILSSHDPEMISLFQHTVPIDGYRES